MCTKERRKKLILSSFAPFFDIGPFNSRILTVRQV